VKLPICLGLSFLCLNIAAPAWAQIPADEPSSSPPSTSAAGLAIAPRVGGSVSTSGSGTPHFSRLDALVPVWQDPGASLTFVEAHLLWLDYETLGASVVVGQRFFEAEGDRIWGGYLAYDTRDTGNNQFHQLGLGLEHLSDAWDARLNGAFPIGETRSELGAPTTIAESVQLSALQFQGNSLLASGQRTTTQLQRFEAALLNLDGEVGGKLFEIGDFAQVRGYGGLYYFNATDIDTLGWRLRLEMRAFDRYTLGLAVQDDAVFSTNLLAGFQVSFGGLVESDGDRGNIARLGNFVSRNSTIAIAEQTETRTLTETLQAQVAVNPVTGEPWFFQHVGNTVGSEGDGTFENPFSTIAAGVNAAGSNGTDNRNEIVYVQFGSNPTQTSAITIPENIQLLSVAPIQTINTQLGTVQLPLSGTGQRPQINATVTMGNSTILSGFNITSVAGYGIFARNVTGFTIADNSISNVTQYGIRVGVDNGSTIGAIAIQNNTLANIGGGSASASNLYDGIFVGASGGSTIADVTITGNTVSNVDNDGLAIGATQASTIARGIIANNAVSNVGRFGIGIGVDTPIPGLGLAASAGSNVANIAITGNTVTTGGRKAGAAVPGANIGVAIQSTTSQVCFSLANNTLTSPPAISLGGITNLQVYLQNGFGNLPVPANFDIVGVNSVANIQSNNNNFTGNIQMYSGVPFAPFVAPAALGAANSSSVSSCP